MSPVHERHYDWHDWCQQIQAAQPMGQWAGTPSSSGHYPETTWDMGTGYGGALFLLASGWPEGTRELRRMTGLAGLRPVERKARLRRCEMGIRPLVPAYLAGDPRCMLLPRPDYRPGRTISILAQCQMRCTVPAEMCYRLGVAILSLVDSLETDGARVELTVVDARCSRPANADYRTYWCVKTADQPLELDRLAFILAHPAFLRRLNFRETERWPELYADYHDGYGWPATRAGGWALGGDYDIVLPYIENIANIDTLTGAIDAVEQIAARALGSDQP